MSWPFENWQQIAIRRFGIQPSEFWAMPLCDWLGLLESVKPRGMDRRKLDDLRALYPDQGDENAIDK